MKAFDMSVCSWNVGKFTQDKVHNLLEKEQKALGEDINPALRVYGFQEISWGEVKKFNKALTTKLKTKNYTKILKKTACNKSKTFQIVLFVFTLNTRHNLESQSKCKMLTKGYVAARLGMSLTLVNTHMPFKTANKTISFGTNMMKWLNDKKLYNENDRDNILLFGDLNSRSLLTQDCYQKNIPTDCPSPYSREYSTKDKKSCQRCRRKFRPNYRQLYCIVKHMLETMKFQDTYPPKVIGEAADEDGAKICFHCNKENKQLFEAAILPQRNKRGLINFLIERDSLCSLKNQLEFKEAKIDFLPTYKRHETKGTFLLEKKIVGRLPGYADRIIFNGPNLSPILYTSLGVKGNDHLPIFGVFRFNPKKFSLDLQKESLPDEVF